MTQVAVDGARYAMAQVPAIRMRAGGYDQDHEILVALPPTYEVAPGRFYPVLWVMDGALLFDLAVGTVSLYTLGNRVPEMIVVGVGHPNEDGLPGLERRTFDLFPPGSRLSDPGLSADYLDEAQVGAELPVGLKADAFLDFLVDELRPALAEQYRMSDDHALFGHSAGGVFTGYAMFARPGAFSRFIVGSGAVDLTFEIEEEYAATHDDLDAAVFFGMGGMEANNLGMSAMRIVSRTTRLAENLLLRRYPSLSVSTRMYKDRDHFTVVPATLGDGLEAVFADEIAKLEKFPW